MRVRLIACVVCAVAGTAALSAAGGHADPAPTGTTFLLKFQPQLARFVDAAPKRGMDHPTPGDVLIGASKVLDQAGTRSVGRTAELCTITSGGSNFACALDVTLLLKDGTLVVSGNPHPARPPWTAAVVGGTGAYAGARGTVRVTDAPHDAGEYWRYDPVP
jgi:hypothetical protein